MINAVYGVFLDMEIILLPILIPIGRPQILAIPSGPVQTLICKTDVLFYGV